MPDNTWTDQIFSEKFACPVHPEVSLPELEPRLFSFNSPHGACPSCHGLGTTCEFDPELIVPDESLSLENGAIEALAQERQADEHLLQPRAAHSSAGSSASAISAPYKEIPKKIQRRADVWHRSQGRPGHRHEFEGVIPNLQRRFEKTESEWVKARLHQYMSEQPCEPATGRD